MEMLVFLIVTSIAYWGGYLLGRGDGIRAARKEREDHIDGPSSSK